MLIKINYANIINIAANREVIPELLQSKCNPKNIFKVVSNFLDNPLKIQEQVKNTQDVLSQFRTNKSSSDSASKALLKLL